MDCPRCANAMNEHALDDVTLDVCEGGCGGVWFDRFELQHVDEASEPAPAGLLNPEMDPRVLVDHAERIRCPRCDGAVMMRHFFSTRHEVEIDECPACGGFWLDAMELGRIRELFGSAEEATIAAREFFHANFGAELDKMSRRSESELRRASRFARLFRMLCPSAYVPGEQRWGAF